MKIGEMAQAAKTNTENIRYYERAGLLPQARRSEANYRVYDAAHIERLAFIRHCRSLDMTLGEIKSLLAYKDSPDDNCAGVNALLDEHIGHVAARIKELKHLQQELKLLRQQCAESQAASECGILAGIGQAASKDNEGAAPAQAEAGHVHGTHRTVGS